MGKSFEDREGDLLVTLQDTANQKDIRIARLQAQLKESREHVITMTQVVHALIKIGMPRKEIISFTEVYPGFYDKLKASYDENEVYDLSDEEIKETIKLYHEGRHLIAPGSIKDQVFKLFDQGQSLQEVIDTLFLTRQHANNLRRSYERRTGIKITPNIAVRISLEEKEGTEEAPATHVFANLEDEVIDLFHRGYCTVKELVRETGSGDANIRRILKKSGIKASSPPRTRCTIKMNLEKDSTR
jgi:hypothetical protein